MSASKLLMGRSNKLHFNVKQSSTQFLRKKRKNPEFADHISKQLSIILSQASYSNSNSMVEGSKESRNIDLANKTTMYLNPFEELQKSPGLSDIRQSSLLKYIIGFSVGCFCSYSLYQNVISNLSIKVKLSQLIISLWPSFIIKEDAIAVMAVLGMVILFGIIIYECSLEKAYKLDCECKSKEISEDILKSLKEKSFHSGKPSFIEDSKIIEIYSSKHSMSEVRFKHEIYQAHLMGLLTQNKSIFKVELIVNSEPQTYWVFKQRKHV